ncbi:3-hydroxyacyl-CoA dehydrogenase NAD-binding domain-containing protein [Pseudogemmobacter sp. W21_MBD1_M6]|uniref:3-hydroxyacyl-CoA dehydrogenase NAD-binding domain-containing protein n=1 Tax=Pseudogemmobacter sp. W21_MBD1_M6 TaxID=3240271 RepID=UPI003F953F7E
MTMGDPVTVKILDGTAFVTIDNPPVNALGHAVRVGLLAALDRLEAAPVVQEIVLLAEGRTFPAGAEIKEFGKKPEDPWLPEIFDWIEQCPKPVIALLHGTVLGGGLELAMAAHYRLADPETKLGLPEVALGILPGAGGTQRAPRLMGADAALDLMLSGAPIGVAEASRKGIIDGVVRGNLPSAGAAFAKSLRDRGAGPRPTRDVTQGFTDAAAYQTAVNARRAAMAGAPQDNIARIIDCVEAAPLLPFEAGMAFERDAFDELVASDQSKALRHAFFAERRAAKVPELATGRARAIHRVAVIGGGLMGAGIAVAHLDAGLEVKLLERDAASLQSALARIAQIYDRAAARGTLSREDRAARLGRVSGTLHYTDLADADLAIEAVVEDLAVKAQVFGRLDAVLMPGAIIASNTSYLDLDVLAAETQRPGDVIGLHFFSPAHVMTLLEVVVGRETGADAVATGFALAKRLGKTAVRAGVTDGFIGNRMLAAYRLAADYTVELGASPFEVDAAMRGYGFAMGPYQVLDMAGLDISWARRKRLAPTRAEGAHYVALGDRLCAAGRFGRKTGRGYYQYPEGSKTGQPDPEVLQMIAAEREAKGISPRSFAPAIIRRRCLAAMANEGMKLLDEGIALRPSDIDTVMIHGHGFPRHAGGPMMAADLTGLPRLHKDLRDLSSEDDALWSPHPMLGELIKNGWKFDRLNEA